MEIRNNLLFNPNDSSALKALIERWSLNFTQLREVRGGLKSRGPNFALWYSSENALYVTLSVDTHNFQLYKG